jgi:serine/threonine protein kinase
MSKSPTDAGTHDMNVIPLPNQNRTGSENCLDIGTRVGEFEITGIVGEGGFGIVYLAFDHSLQRTIALKEYMPPALAGRGGDNNIVVRSKRHQETFDAGLKSFINEARLLAQFDHPALVKVYRFWEQNNTAYMAMRYYEGRTLKDIIGQEPEVTTETWWKSALKPILEALDVLYGVQILHRDISPENIMIQPNGEPVLLDFGAARQLMQNSTQALTVILKPGYAPIEQYADDPSMKQGPWTDIYALSAVVYSTITKKAPPASVARMIKDPMEPLSPDAYPGYSRQFLFAISKGMAVKPDDRPQTIAEFSRLLGLDKTASDASGTLPVSPAVESRLPGDETKSLPAAVAQPGPGIAPKKHRRQAAGTGTAPVKKWAIGVAGTACAVALGLYLFKDDGNAPSTSTVAQAEAAPAAHVAAARSADAEQAIEQPDAGRGPLRAASSIKQTELTMADRNSKSPNRSDGKTAHIASPDAAKAAGQEAGGSMKETGTLHIQVKPWANILVDGVPMGVSPPLKKMALSVGQHEIRVMNPHFRDHVVNIEVASRKPVRIEHDFSRTKK